MNKLKHMLLALTISLHAASATLETVENTLALKGTVETHHIESVQLPFNAKVKPLKAFGQIIEKGEPMLKIGYFSQSDSIAHHVHQYLQQEKRLLLDAKHMQTLDALIEVGAVSQKEYISAKLDFEQKQTKLLENQKELEEILNPYQISLDDLIHLEHQSLESIHLYIEKHIPDVMYAPITGILLPCKNDAGHVFQKFTNIVKIADHHALEISMQVTEKQLSQLSEGLNVKIHLPALNEDYQGSVYTVNRYPGSDHKYTVVVRFAEVEEESLAKINLGMKAIVNVTLEEKEVLLIPINSIKDINDKSMVVLAKSGKIKTITVGQTYGMNIEVISGLEPGEEVLEHHSN